MGVEASSRPQVTTTGAPQNRFLRISGVAGRQPAARPVACDRGCYLPREVFFGRLGFAGAFFTVWAEDFVRFLPATSDSFPIDVLPGAPYRGSPAPVPPGRLPPGHGLRRGRPRRLAGDSWAQPPGTSADLAAGRCGADWDSVCAADVAEWRNCDTLQ